VPRRPSPARSNKRGGGVLFLDEVGEMRLSVQANVFRVLQKRGFQREPVATGTVARAPHQSTEIAPEQLLAEEYNRRRPGIAERFVRTVRTECLNWMLIVNAFRLSLRTRSEDCFDELFRYL
jgi:sigma54-dependent transcription regulator